MTPRRRDGALLPLFPLKTVLFPGGVLALRVFEQRYIAMVTACIRDASPFGVCLVTKGEEVAQPSGPAEFADVGTLATVASWDMPEQGILHVTAEGGERFLVRSHRVEPGGLAVAETGRIPAEPAVALPERYASLARLLEAMAARVGAGRFPQARAFGDASWVGYRLAELLPLPLAVRQGMLEINDAEIRLSLLQRFLHQQGLA